MTVSSKPLFLYGPGYSATVLGRLWPGTVYATVRSAQRLRQISQTHMLPVRLDQEAAISQAINDSHLVISVPPDGSGCPALQHLGEHIHRAASVLYLSTTAVYGDLQGGWAMDWSALRPGSDRALRRVKAEQAWLSRRPDVCLVRLPGIYGQFRSPLDRLRAGQARQIIKPGQVFSRIHVEDLAHGLKALIKAQGSGSFNLCDDLPAQPQQVMTYAAGLLGLPEPQQIPFEQAELSEMAKSFYSECKRVSNARIKALTGWRPAYPTYKEGLNAIHQAEQADLASGDSF